MSQNTNTAITTGTEPASNNILQYIRSSQRKRIIYPLILLLLTIVFTVQQPIFEYLHLQTVAANTPLSSVISDDRPYVTTHAADLYYTGSDYWANGQLTGHYYYQLADSYCRFYILPAASGRPAQSHISAQTITGRAVNFRETTDEVLADMAKQLEWNKQGLISITDPYLINTISYLPVRQQLLFAILVICFFFSLFEILCMLIYMINPKQAPVYRRLRKYGSASHIIKDVEKELNESCIVKTGGMSLTPSYLVEFSEDLNAVVPLESVLWAYKHGELKWSWKLKKKMRYTFHVVTMKGDHYTFKNKHLRDVEKIQNELTNRYPNFFYGYSEEHEEMVAHILKDVKADQKKK